jgi:hypothetical protein
MTKKMTESPQVSRTKLTTPVRGGVMPSGHDIIESANARAQQRHSPKGTAQSGTSHLPDSIGHTVDRAGIHNEGYLTKKSIKGGVNEFYNSLPPGMHIEDQENADIHGQPFGNVMERAGYSSGVAVHDKP